MKEQEIILAKICAILDKQYFIIEKNGEIKKYLKCCGLGRYYDQNKKFFEPYYYNENWENHCPEYNLFIGLDNVFALLLKDENIKGVYLLVIELGKNINSSIIFRVNSDKVYKKCLDELQNLYQLLGYELVMKDQQFDVIPYSGNGEKVFNLYGLEQWLYNNYPEVYDSYEGSIEAYTSNNYGTSIEACRTTLTSLFSKYKGTEQFAKWFRGAADISGELAEDNISDIKKRVGRFF